MTDILFSEEQRMQALLELDILDTPDEVEYDQLVQLASQICAAPISLVSLVDHQRQWFKAAVGLSARETHRSVSFCAHAIRQPELFIVEDATFDSRFKDNALVTGAPNIRFYAGVPIHSPNGAPLGTLCVIDTEPRTLSEGQRRALTILGLQVQARLDLRYKKNLLERALAENQQLNESLKATNALFEKFMENGPFVSYIKNPGGRFEFFKSHLSEKFGIRNEEFLGRTIHDFFPAEIADAHRENDLEVMSSGRPRQFSEVSPGLDGGLLRWNSYKFPIQNAAGETLLAGISIDVTEDVARQEALAEAYLEVERLATLDALTGLANRRVFQERIGIEYSIAMRKNRPLALAMMDIDNFKRWNDEFGHAAGDACLRFVGKVLRESVRKGDLAVRLGGEEFGLLLPETDTAAAVLIAERVQLLLKTAPDAPEGLSVSVGVAATGQATQNWEQLFSQSDQAMYVAKRNGKDRVAVYGAQSAEVDNLVR